MTDATVEQQGESKRLREHPEVPQAADSSSSSSESSTDTEMGLVDVCTILCDNSEVSKRDRVTEKPAAVAGGREGGPVTLDEMGFQQSRLPNQMQKIERNFEAVVADGITDRFWWKGRGANSGGCAPGIHL